jgi:hypothetical protein
MACLVGHQRAAWCYQVDALQGWLGVPKWTLLGFGTVLPSGITYHGGLGHGHLPLGRHQTEWPDVLRWTLLGFNSPAVWQNEGSNKAWCNTESSLLLTLSLGVVMTYLDASLSLVYDVPTPGSINIGLKFMPVCVLCAGGIPRTAISCV